MFLQYFIWGAWYTSVAVYMTESGMGDLTHWPFTVNPVAAIIAPFFIGFIADRYFATEKVLGILHLLGASFMIATPFTSGIPVLFILFLLGYNLCYMPTMSLANTLAFRNIDDQKNEFPIIRVFGTIGWIVAGFVVSFGLGSLVVGDLRPEQTALPLYLSAFTSILLGIYSFTLPHTPPETEETSTSIKSILGFDVMKELGNRSFYVFLISSMLISIPLAAYFNFTQVFLSDAGFTNIAATQTIGQMSEVLFMVLMPFFFIRLGVKWMLAVGMFTWVIRYALFAIGSPEPISWMIIFGIALHGVCYDFFFVTGYIYTDIKSSNRIRGQAQGLLILLTYGVGMLIGAQLTGLTYNFYLGNAANLSLDQWFSFWWIPSLLAAGVLAFFVILFKEKVVGDSTRAEDVKI